MKRMTAALIQALSNGRTSAKAIIGKTNQTSAHRASTPMIDAARMSHFFMGRAPASVGSRQQDIDAAVFCPPARRLVGRDGLVWAAPVGLEPSRVLEKRLHDPGHRRRALHRKVLVVLEFQ